MKKGNLLNTMVLAALTLPSMAFAGGDHSVSSNVGLYSDYLFRGISQTGGSKPALQGGIDYSHASGLYVGVWGSNISWVSDAGGVTFPRSTSAASLEVDTYIGFGSSIAEDVNYDVGFLRYNYPGVYAAGATKADTNEIYGAIGWKWLALKYSRSLSDTFGVSNASGSNYIDLTVSYAIEDSGITLGAHYGQQKYKGSTADASVAAGADPSYSDYSLSVSKDFSGYEVGLAYSSTNAKKGVGQFYNVILADGSNVDLGKGTTVLSVAHSF